MTSIITGPARLLVVDPGKITGIALIEVVDNAPVIRWSDELNWDDSSNRINQTLCDDATTQIVMEKFTITPQTGKNGPGALFSIELIGVARYLAKAYGSPEMVFQTPQRAKQFCDNVRLKQLGFWHRGGAGHARDALRHGVLYLVEHGWQPGNLLA